MLRLIQTLIRLEWPVRLLAPAIGRYNPFLPSFRVDPYPQYRRLRERAPIYFSPALRGWILTRYDDVVRALADPRLSVQRERGTMAQRLDVFGSLGPEFRRAVTRSLLMLDPPDHTRIRRLVSKAFTPRMIERVRPRVEELVDELLDSMERRADPDLIRDLADPLPTIVISELLGVPAEDHPRIKGWSDDAVTLLDPFQAEDGLAVAERAFGELRDYLHGVFAERRRAPRDDLLSALVAAEERGDTLSEGELDSLCLLLLVAGNETTTNLIGNGALALVRHPSERRRLVEAPELSRSAVEELLRFDSPIQTTDRVALEDLELEGRHVRRGQTCGLVLGAANRDPERFSEPDRLDLSRPDNQHLAFGHGAHFCLGAQLARLEGQVAIERLFTRYPGLDAEPRPADYKRSVVLRGLRSLPLRLGRGTRARAATAGAQAGS